MRKMSLDIDYKLIRALNAVVSEKSFEKGADKLHVTQSAISQRIKLLEQLMAEPVIVRGTPPVATALGQKLIKHLKQVTQLEHELLHQVRPEEQGAPITIAIATNADSLASWFIPAITPVLKTDNVILDLHVANELDTQNLLKKGEVFGAISSREKAISGCKTQYLGKLKYLLCASPEFKNKYFADGLSHDNLKRAPAVDFDQNDTMHKSYLADRFSFADQVLPCHRVRSSEAFVTMAVAGIAYSILPITQAKPFLQSGQLIDLAPQQHLIQDLYWHSWVLEKGAHKRISSQIVSYAKQILS